MRSIGYVKNSNHIKKLENKYSPEKISVDKLKWTNVEKSTSSSLSTSLKFISPPISMKKLIKMLDLDEYHYSCVDAISESCFIKFECNHPEASAFFENIQLPQNEDIISIFSDFIHYYIATGNGFLMKMRSLTGQWVGLNRLIPSEVMIAEKYDDYGFLAPDYIQVKNGLKSFVLGRDIIHLLQKNSQSNAWGVACEPIIYNIETLHEIKTYDFNRFKEGLLIDYFIIVEGGALKEGVDEKGNKIDSFKEIQSMLQQAKGNSKSHATILLEIPEQNAKVKLEPLRHNDNDFESLKTDLRDGIIVYHRVPHRLVSLQTPGKLGGDETGDLAVFYNMVIKPLQERVAFALCKELKREFGWDVKVTDFDFGDISAVLERIDSRLFGGGL